MPRLSLWNSGHKGADYKFIDRNVSEWFGAGGVAVYCHKYLGTYAQSEDGDDGNTMTIQDVLLLENRDRKYSEEIFELRGQYNVEQVEGDLRQFGFFMMNDTLFIYFHLNDTLALLGRKIMNGDVLELPNLRDDALLDEDAPAINKFYVVEDVTRASEGYSATWFPHIIRVKAVPMKASQEFEDIMEKQAKDPFGFDQGLIRDLMTTYGKDMEIDEAVVEMAKESVSGRNFETQQFYVVPGDELTGQLPWVFAGDGIPPNGAELAGSGSVFPLNPSEGTYYLRTDYEPKTLFRYSSGRWVMQEQDYREQNWNVAHRILEGFINNNNQVTHDDGIVADEKQPLYKAIKPRADF